MLWISLLIIHGLMAFALLGAVTHQAASLFWTRGKRDFIESYASVRSQLFTNGIIILFLLTFTMGSWIYTNYRYTVRPVLEDLGYAGYVGIFEYKEHVLAVALCMLPAYWLLWKRVPLTEQTLARKALTLIVTLSVWIGFIGGHLVNNARGL
ncbi:hypothetical protein BH10PSE12_BH10PSE12_34300 [soil metagenome]